MKLLTPFQKKLKTEIAALEKELGLE